MTQGHTLPRSQRGSARRPPCMGCERRDVDEMASMTIGEIIRKARNGRSQKAFADLLGVRQSSVSRYESGKASPPASVIDACMRLVHQTNTHAPDAVSRTAARQRPEPKAARAAASFSPGDLSSPAREARSKPSLRIPVAKQTAK